MVSPPFGIYHGHSRGPVDVGVKPYTLVYVPERRILATFRHVDKAQALASELAPTLWRGCRLRTLAGSWSATAGKRCRSTRGRFREGPALPLHILPR
jgi:hypothetical protein